MFSTTRRESTSSAWGARGNMMMKAFPALHRSLAAVTTAVVLAAVTLTVVSYGRNSEEAAAPGKLAADAGGGHNWSMYGGSIHRNPVNTVDKNIPSEWDVTKGTNVKWAADLGSKA